MTHRIATKKKKKIQSQNNEIAKWLQKKKMLKCMLEVSYTYTTYAIKGYTCYMNVEKF